MKTTQTPLLIIVMAFSLSACGGGSSSGGGSDVRSDNFDTSALQGLWDASETDEDGEDILYSDFSVSGVLDVYDYDLDDYGDGENCHHKYSYQVQNHGNGIYEYLVPGFPTKVHLTVRGDLMDVREQAVGPIGVTYERVLGLSTADLKLCE